MASKKNSDAPKRRNLTPAERIAKAEAELAALRAKAEEKNQRKATALIEQRDKLVDRIRELQAKADAINLELDSLGHIDQPAVDEKPGDIADVAGE